ncbi:MAG: bifunctional diaminohydroxyphosphoribosylaminopyrimidine deaminase/5-amino-6-(5-phosphoribosylamino)uracil reductase RibD [bacterium JZ-2024 1]
MSIHEVMMRRCFELARRAEGYASPNPLVGCVIVNQGRIVGEGIHWGPGRVHAERMALFRAGPGARGATLYVNLEPCVHWGRTPPCTHIIVESGIRRVFCSVGDPWYRIAGRGFRFLRNAGIEVHTGVLEIEGKALNHAFLKWCTARRPYVVVKVAVSSDGKLALRGRGRVWVTSEESRADARRLRFLCDAVVVGARTVALDDPRLTIRLKGIPEKPLLKVILDGAGRTSPKARVFKSPPVAVFTGMHASREWLDKIRATGAVMIQEPIGDDGKVPPERILEVLAAMGAGKILIEGGADVISAFLQNDLVDEAWVYIAPSVFGARGQAWTETLKLTTRKQAFISEVTRVGPDLKMVLRFTNMLAGDGDVLGNH